MISTNVLSQDINVENERKSYNTTQEINKKRLTWTLGSGSAVYLGTSVSLYKTWYQDYPRSSFHLFDDFKEWRGVDKGGHIFSAYFQSNWAYKSWRWIGLDKKEAIWAGAGVGFLAQTTIEVMDGFSDNWGFSIPDFGANLIGIGSFASQQALWDEQRILLKTSSSPINYAKRYGSDLFQTRADQLFGTHYMTRFLKDYNAQTTWISVNLKSFFRNSKLPDWLNVALGYGAENMFGGFSNSIGDTGLSPNSFQRYSQFYLSLDIDLSRIKTESPFLRTLLDILNIIKIPFTTLEFNTLGQVKLHSIRF